MADTIRLQEREIIIMTTPLSPIITEEIASKGFMRLDRYMALALGHPQHGYYMSGRSFGLEGDFITAPEISQMFGELIGLWSLDQLQRQNLIETAGFFELGPGRGTLMADAIRAITPFTQEHIGDMPIHLMEMSPALKQQQTKALHPHPVIHHDSLDDLPPIPLIFIANEFFDALPIRQFIKSDQGWHERVVTMADGKLNLTTMASDDAPIADDIPMGSVYEIAPHLHAIITKISRHIYQYGGAALIIDYGKTNPIGDSLQAVHQHKPVDILDSPGKADLSAWVDFNAIKTAAADMRVLGTCDQGRFLKSLGLYQRAEQLSASADPKTRRMIAAAIDRLSSPAQMGRVFQTMAILPPDAEGDVAGFMP